MMARSGAGRWQAFVRACSVGLKAFGDQHAAPRSGVAAYRGAIGEGFRWAARWQRTTPPRSLGQALSGPRRRPGRGKKWDTSPWPTSRQAHEDFADSRVVLSDKEGPTEPTRFDSFSDLRPDRARDSRLQVATGR